MLRGFVNALIACGAVVAVTALAWAEETIVEKHTVESQHEAVESAPAVREQRVEERTVTQRPAVVKKRTDTLVTHSRDDDNDNSDDNDND